MSKGFQKAPISQGEAQGKKPRTVAIDWLLFLAQCELLSIFFSEVNGLSMNSKIIIAASPTIVRVCKERHLSFVGWGEKFIEQISAKEFL